MRCLVCCSAETLDRSNNTMANAVNGDVQEDGENASDQQGDEDMEEGLQHYLPLNLLLVFVCVPSIRQDLHKNIIMYEYVEIRVINVLKLFYFHSCIIKKITCSG